MNSRNWIIGALAVALGLAAISHIHNGAAESENRTQPDAELIAAKAVSVLPPGTEDAWLAYIDRRMKATLHRSGNVIEITNGLNEALEMTEYVSANSPYEISCSFLGGTVTFGYASSTSCDDNGVPETDSDYEVKIYGSVTTADASAEKAPPLGVSEQSVAATHLNRVLCQKIAEHMQEIMAAQPLQCGAQR